MEESLLCVLMLVLQVAGFNLDTTHSYVYNGSDNFGYQVSLRNSSGDSSLFVAAVTTRATGRGHPIDEKMWFQCPINGSLACISDPNYNSENAADDDSGIFLKTGKNSTKERKLKFKRQSSGRLKITVHERSFPNKQIWSSDDIVHPGNSYGESLCITDFNNDGWDDLVVGEPHYIHDGNEMGRAFIHIGQLENVFYTRFITGENVHGGLFASSISCIGDMDQDGRQDIAVGAPGEPGGGAIYIYRGSAEGLNLYYSQHILAAQVDNNNEGIQGFGVSISDGVDVDANHYNDIAVGASESGHAVFLWARPVVHLHASLNSSIAQINNDTMTFNITFFINFTACHDQHPIDVAVVMRADSLLCVPDGDRSCTCTTGNVLYNKTKMLLQNNVTSDVVSVTLKRGVLFSPAPMEVKLDYELAHASETNVPVTRPMVDPKHPKQQVLKINHTFSCANHTCLTHLRLHAHIDNTTMNETAEQQSMKINVSVESVKEPAFLTTLILKSSLNLPLVNSTVDCYNSSCDSTTQLECHVGNPLTITDGKKTFVLELNLKNIPPSSETLELNLTVTSAGEEKNYTDNTLIIIIPTAFVPESISSSSNSWITAVVIGGIIACGLMAAMLFAIFRNRSFTPWKEKVFYNLVSSEPEHSSSGGREGQVSIENELYDTLEDSFSNSHGKI